jgi:DNA-directed RNA polymerase subunit RPC12/RpoP
MLQILLQLLLKMKLSESEPQRLGHYTRILVDIPVHSKHRLICFRYALLSLLLTFSMGINKNLQIQNYKFAARILQVIPKSNLILISQALIPLNLQDKSQLEDKLSQCESNLFRNTYLYPYTCTSCKNVVDYLEPKCTSCSSKPLFCTKVRQFSLFSH